MKIAGSFAQGEEIDALLWRVPGKSLGLLLPYWRDSAVLVLFGRRFFPPHRPFVEAHLTYKQGSARMVAHRRRVYERAIARRNQSI